MIIGTYQKRFWKNYKHNTDEMQKRVRRVKGVSINNKKGYWKCNILENIWPLILPCGQPI